MIEGLREYGSWMQYVPAISIEVNNPLFSFSGTFLHVRCSKVTLLATPSLPCPKRRKLLDVK